MTEALERNQGVLRQKILYVPAGFGEPGEDAAGLSLSTREMQMTRQIFESAGYYLRTGIAGEGDMQSLGIYADARFLGSSINREISRCLSLRDPQRIRIDTEIHEIPFPVVAKYPLNLHGGRGVYLIESPEQLQRLRAGILTTLTPQLVRDITSKMSLYDGAADVKEILDMGYFQGLIGANPSFIESHPLLEYIKTPSRYNTSFRVVADGHGVVHYGALLRSSLQKGAELAVSTFADTRRKETLLFEDPLSPLFLMSKKITSNQAQGGKVILLDRQPVTDTIDAEVVTAHGIDPEQPTIPQGMLEKASQIGRFTRLLYPYVGIDFVLDSNNGNALVFLEVNAPVIYPQELGIKEEVEALSLREQRSKATLEMMKRVAFYGTDTAREM